MPLPTTTRRFIARLAPPELALAIPDRQPNLLGTASPDPESSSRAFDPHRRLLVVGLARDRIERALRDLVGVGFGVVERHEHLPGRDRLGDAQLDARARARAATRRRRGPAA